MNVLLLDRDGTLNIDNGHVYTPDDLQLVPHVIDALLRFQDAGYRFFIITNQGAIGRGMQTMEQYEETEAHCETLLMEAGIAIEGAYICPHHPDEGCFCRKPGTGMWEQLQNDHADVAASECIMIGDKDADVLFGKAIGAKTARINSGQYPKAVKADYEVRDLGELADILLAS